MVILVALLIAGGGFFQYLDQPLPQGQMGPEAEALAQRLQEAAGVPAWAQTGAVRWTFAGHHHLWDRQRSWARVRWDDFEVQLDVDRKVGLAWRQGALLPAAEAQKRIEQAWRLWINDSFWLNPVAKFFDPGTERRLVALPGGEEGLLISYHSGGATPGDSYLWLAGEDGLPRAWRMWVSIIPLGGLQASWEHWITLDTGARVATRHRLWRFTLELQEVAGARTLAELEPAPDPFAALAVYLVPTP